MDRVSKNFGTLDMLVGGKERVLVWCRTSSVIFLGREGSGGGWSYILSVLLLPAIGAGFGDRYSINLMSIGHYGVYSSGSGLSGLNISSKFFSDLRIGSIDGAFRSMKEGKEEGDFASVDGFFGYHYMPDRICHNVEGKSDPRADSSDSELYNRGSRPNADLGMTRDVQGGLHVPRDRDPPVVPHRFTLRSVITFIEGSVAGCAGAMFVYPIGIFRENLRFRHF